MLEITSEHVWLAGKGSSLGGFNWKTAGKYRVGINETAFLIPGCWGTFALDYGVLEKYDIELDPGIIVFLPVTQHKHKYPIEYRYSKGEEILDRFATAPAAIQVLHYIGFRHFHFVGFDSIDGNTGYAQAITDMGAEGTTRDGYKKINEHIIRILDRLAIIPYWEHLK